MRSSGETKYDRSPGAGETAALETAGRFGPTSDGTSGASFFFLSSAGAFELPGEGDAWAAASDVVGCAADGAHTPRISCMASRSSARNCSIILNGWPVSTNAYPRRTISPLKSDPSLVNMYPD